MDVKPTLHDLEIARGQERLLRAPPRSDRVVALEEAATVVAAAELESRGWVEVTATDVKATLEGGMAVMKAALRNPFVAEYMKDVPGPGEASLLMVMLAFATEAGLEEFDGYQEGELTPDELDAAGELLDRLKVARA